MVQETFTSALQNIELPFHNSERWETLKRLYLQLEMTRDARETALLLREIYRESGNEIEPLNKTCHCQGDVCEVLWPFCGLQFFLEKLASTEEKQRFFSSTLPFVASLASRLMEFAPRNGVPLVCRQRDACVALDRKFIASLLASGLLCGMPPGVKNKYLRSINFANFYSCFHRSECQLAQASKLRCFLHYFERLQEVDLDLSGMVTYSRQVIEEQQLPSLEDWLQAEVPLCPVIVDQHGAIEDSGSHMLQVDFANCFIGGGVLGGGSVQEEIRFCINPELTVAMLMMEAMQDNEAIIIKGTKRFSNYKGYGRTFEYAGSHDYTAKRDQDEEGNIDTTVVAIDAKSFKHRNAEAQYENEMIVRELNKALAGFYNPQHGCDLLVKLDSPEVASTSPDLELLTLHSETLQGSDVEDFAASFASSSIGEALSQLYPGLSSSTTDSSTILSSLSSSLSQLPSNSDSVDESADDIVSRVMKRSIEELFRETPHKMKVYSETVIRPSLLPKCMNWTSTSGTATPLVPGTPPPSPAVVIGQDRLLLLNHSGIQTPTVPNTSPSTLASDAAAILSTSSFADSLSESLLKCVELSTSLANAIAAVASNPVQMASVTMETFEKSPRDLGSPVKNGEHLILYLSQKMCGVEPGKAVSASAGGSSGNGYKMSEFVEELTTLVSAQKAGRRHSGDRTGGNSRTITKQDLTKTFEVIENSEMAHLESQVNCIFDVKPVGDFAINLAHSSSKDAILSFPVADNGSSLMSARGGVEVESSGMPTGRESQARALSSAIITAAVSELADDIKEKNFVRKVDEIELNQCVIEALPSDKNHNLVDLNSVVDDEGLRVENCGVSDSLISKLFNAVSESFVQEIMLEGLVEAANSIEVERQANIASVQYLSCTDNNKVGTDRALEYIEGFTDGLCQDVLSYSVPLAAMHCGLHSEAGAVRPLATGNWGCGAFRGDPELKAVLQWVAASVAGCPAVVYHTFGDKRVSQLFQVRDSLQARDWNVHDVMQGVLRFCDSMRTEREKGTTRPSLLEALLATRQTGL